MLGTADEVPSPLQVSLVEPAQGAAMWGAGEAGVAAALSGGELLLAATDRSVPGRAMPFSLTRTYRSGMLGYGPLGSAGWWATLFAHLRELPATGEVEYHDGTGHVWRLLPRALPEAPDGYEKDDPGSYYVPHGVYLRLQKLAGGRGWRLSAASTTRRSSTPRGGSVEIDDRHSAAAPRPKRGRHRQPHAAAYDAFGQLDAVTDDLGRHYAFAWFDDPRPVSEGGDGPRYGLLE